MRTLPPALAASLAGGATTLCQCWLLTRRDGLSIGLTDHDRDLAVGPHLFEATGGIDATASEAGTGLATGGGEISGMLSSARILPEDIANGLYDGARLEAYLVDWQAPALDFLARTLVLGEIRQRDGRFVAETRDAFHALDEERGRVYSGACPAELGDARCGVNIAAPPHRITGTVLATDGRATLSAAAFTASLPGSFTRGLLTLTSGANAGATFTIKEHRAGGEIALWQPLARPLAPGDAFTATAGCDKRFATCRDRFDNAANFRGFPFIPAPEFVFAYARPGEGRHRGRPLVP